MARGLRRGHAARPDGQRLSPRRRPTSRACWRAWTSVAGLRRLRFTTSHPEHVDARMADALRDLPRCARTSTCRCSPGPTGSWRSMRRGYTRGAVPRHGRRCCGTAVPDLALSSDVIVGYPGETEGEFEDTLRRPGDGGLRWPLHLRLLAAPWDRPRFACADDVPEAEKKRRLHVVNAHQQQWQRRRNEARVGTRRGRPGRDARRRRPGLGPDTALPHRPLRRAQTISWAAS